ncbi:hypothetical protein ACLB2K_005688 [Fragaria x ananassa]
MSLRCGIAIKVYIRMYYNCYKCMHASRPVECCQSKVRMKRGVYKVQVCMQSRMTSRRGLSGVRYLLAGYFARKQEETGEESAWEKTKALAAYVD